MVTMTIHADEPLAEAIRRAAADAGQSVNTFVKETVGSAIGVLGRKPREPAFLRNLPQISKKGYEDLISVQKDFDVIDKEMWK